MGNYVHIKGSKSINVFVALSYNEFTNNDHGHSRTWEIIDAFEKCFYPKYKINKQLVIDDKSNDVYNITKSMVVCLDQCDLVIMSNTLSELMRKHFDYGDYFVTLIDSSGKPQLSEDMLTYLYLMDEKIPFRSDVKTDINIGKMPSNIQSDD